MSDEPKCRPEDGVPCGRCRPGLLALLDARIDQAETLALAHAARNRRLDEGHWRQVAIYLRELRRAIA